MRTFSLLNLALVFPALTACSSAERPAFSASDYPGELRGPDGLPFDVVWQQRVTAHWGDGQQRGFDAALQKQGDKLTVLGLSPTGSVGFVITLQNGEVAVENRTSMELPFPARFIVLDVQRAFYSWLPPGVPAGMAARVASARVDGERVIERWAGGRLVERRFERDDRAEPIVVHYDWAQPDWRGPSRVRLENGWFGYELVVDTHAETVLTKAGLPEDGGR
ncbi:MAG: DUF3261 domain-containing protein [bacterium]|nr:DUF3261 domain-containing protein [bacterium]